MKFCTSKNFPLYGTSSYVNWFLTQNQRKALCLLARFSSTAADLGDYESEEMDAEYLTEQGLLSTQVSQSLVSWSSFFNYINCISLIRCHPLFFFLFFFCRTLWCGCYSRAAFISLEKPANINNGWIRHIRAIQ